MNPFEAQMWAILRACIKQLDPQRVENLLALGTPDVNYIGGWIELKQIRGWPPEGQPVKIDHFTKEQRAWAIRRGTKGGLSFLLVRIGYDEWVLLHGKWAAQNIGKATRTSILDNALVHTTQGLPKVKAELLRCLQSH